MKLLKYLLVLALTISCSGLVASSSPEQIVLTSQNSVLLLGEVNDQAVDNVMHDILDLREKNEKSKIYISILSPGGNIDAGMRLIRFLKTQENVDTITVFGASMASGIVEGNPGERLILKDGTLMFHRATVTLSGQIDDGELESRLAYFKEIVDDMEKTNYERMMLTKADYKAYVKDELWLFGQRAIREHAADRIVSIKCSKELLKTKISMSIKVLIFSNTVEVSACPLLN